MKILVINAGSSSLKYQLIDMTMRKYSQKETARELALETVFSAIRLPTAARRN